ncbi:MAG TPA: flagellar type III secretion system pore protein FliP, partial [Alphaproteobacteria bacterium]|nr:flagellar type III secretion system pore protein FliP [Alphaproteobacteria bacterium]
MSLRLKVFAVLGLVLAALLIADPAMAQQINIDLGQNSTLTSRIVQLIALVTVLSLAPSILIVVTSFTRIIVVLSLLRSAMGVQQTPPNTVLISLALFLTAFIMAPTFQKSYNDGIQPFMADQIDAPTAFQKGVEPFKEFMLAHVRDKDLKLFMDMSKTAPPDQAIDTPLQVLIPAYLISELNRAFQIGFLLFVPFVVIDMVIASVLMSMGMMMLPP